MAPRLARGPGGGGAGRRHATKTRRRPRALGRPHGPRAAELDRHEPERCNRGRRGARGAPEARGKCLEGTCALLSEKTHVYDVANRPWLLPYIADRATGGDRAFLVALIRHASAEDPDDRPSFTELVAAIDRRVDGVTVN